MQQHKLFIIIESNQQRIFHYSSKKYCLFIQTVYRRNMIKIVETYIQIRTVSKCIQLQKLAKLYFLHNQFHFRQ
ncbi:hypothetical protein pb186bvf_000257 [Paramecium bursaria]